jgi:hypothetical protein
MRMSSLADARWRKSSRSSGAQNCVEVACGAAWVALRDSKNPQGTTLMLTTSNWRGLLSTLKADC